MAYITASGGTSGDLTNSSGTNGQGWTSPGYGVEKKVTASLDPTGYSETKDVLNDANNLGKDAWKWAKGAWDTFAGKNNYRAPEKVFDPYAQYDSSDSNQARAAAGQSYGALSNPNAYYAGLMSGTSPSLAQNQMQQGIAQAQQTGMQAASGARGMDRAAAFRNAQNNSANLAGQAAIAGGQQRMQEQQLGAQGYSQGLQAQSNMANTTRAQDIQEQQGLMNLQNQSQANLNNQYAINAGITSGNAANGQKAAGGLVQMGGSLLGGAMMSDIRAKDDIQPYAGPDPNAMARALAPGVTASAPAASNPMAAAFANYGGGQGAGNNGAMFNSQDSQNFANIGSAASTAASGQESGGGGIMGGGGGMLGGMLSDENSKESLKGIHPYQFDYKDQFAHQMATDAASKAYAQAFADAKTPRMGVMAQDLAANPEARDTVTKTPEGMLAIDGKRALGFVLANQADFNDRLRRVESNGRS